MKDDRKTLSISLHVYKMFKEFCDKENLKIAKHAEKVLLNYIESAEKNNETHEQYKNKV